MDELTTDKVYRWQTLFGVTAEEGELHVGYVIEVENAKGVRTQHEVMSVCRYTTRRGAIRIKALLSEEL